jgi:natural product biosynthesis luciferase-like monooxygenase protein
MRFGLQFMLSCSPDQSPVQVYRDTVEQAVHAEALGFESVWAVEQHFCAGVSVSPSPLLLLSAIAARTRTIRLGTGVILLPLWHPLRVAEEVAVLDVLSDGRVEVGVGRGSDATHFEGFDVEQAKSRDRLEEGLDLLRRAWTEERLSFAGRFTTVRDVALAPRPVQQPHPPIRVATNSAESLERAGRLGQPISVASHINPFPRLAGMVDTYRAARRAAGHPDDPDDVTILVPTFVGPDPETVRRTMEPGVQNFLRVTRAHASALLNGTGGNRADDGQRAGLEAIIDRLERLTYDDLPGTMAIFDTPDGCRHQLKAIGEDLGVDRVVCWFTMGGVGPHAQVMASMDRFAAEVMPYV